MEWVAHGGAGFSDVPFMTDWPLCPIQHLGGDLSTLIEQRYPLQTLKSLGLTHSVLRNKLYMTDAAMSFFGFDIRGWAQLGFDQTDLRMMQDATIWALFGVDRATAGMIIGGIQSGFSQSI
jgi:hypothetical protein